MTLFDSPSTRYNNSNLSSPAALHILYILVICQFNQYLHDDKNNVHVPSIVELKTGALLRNLNDSPLPSLIGKYLRFPESLNTLKLCNSMDSKEWFPRKIATLCSPESRRISDTHVMANDHQMIIFFESEDSTVLVTHTIWLTH